MKKKGEIFKKENKGGGELGGRKGSGIVGLQRN